MSTQLVWARKMRKTRTNGKYGEPSVKIEERAYDPAYIEDQNQFTDENGVYFEIDKDKTEEHRKAVEKRAEERKNQLAMSGISAEALAKALVGNMSAASDAPKGKPGRKAKTENTDENQETEE